MPGAAGVREHNDEFIDTSGSLGEPDGRPARTAVRAVLAADQASGYHVSVIRVTLSGAPAGPVAC